MEKKNNALNITNLCFLSLLFSFSSSSSVTVALNTAETELVPASGTYFGSLIFGKERTLNRSDFPG